MIRATSPFAAGLRPGSREERTSAPPTGSLEAVDPGSAEKPDREPAQQRLDALEVLIGCPQHGIGGMGRNSNLEVGQGQNFAAVAQFGGQQAHALPCGAVKLGPWQTGKRRDQIGAVAEARAGDQFGQDWAASENLASIESRGQFGGDVRRACT
jgi:hypothetical protein